MAKKPPVSILKVLIFLMIILLLAYGVLAVLYGLRIQDAPAYPFRMAGLPGQM